MRDELIKIIDFSVLNLIANYKSSKVDSTKDLSNNMRFRIRLNIISIFIKNFHLRFLDEKHDRMWPALE